MCLTCNICKLNSSNKHLLWFNWSRPFFFSSHLTVCASNFGHENSLIIFLIRACLLRCHYSSLVEQSPHPFNLDSKYHLHFSGEIVTSSQHVGACTYACVHTHTHTHIFEHLIIVTSNKIWMMDGFATCSGPNRSAEFSHPAPPIFSLSALKSLP